MAKTKAPTVSIDEAVNQGLLKLATTDGPWRLSGKGDEYLFPSAGAGKQAAAACQNDGLVLVAGAGKTQTVSLTAAGFARVSGSLPDDRLGPLAARIADTLPLADRVDFLQRVVTQSPPATVELLPILEAAVTAEKAEREAAALRDTKRREREAAAADAIQKWLALVQARKQERIAALQAALAEEGVTTAADSGPRHVAPPPPPATGPLPTTPEERSYRRDVANQLVSMWREAWDKQKADPREYLEAAIWNVPGFVMIGEPGAELPFDGKFHECPTAVSTGTPVRVVRPGWALDEDDYQYVALKAAVTP